MPNLLTPLPFLDASEQPANGFIFTQATRAFTTATGFITTVRSMGRIVDGVFLTADDSKSDPFVLVSATVDAPLSITIKLDSYDASGRLAKGSGSVPGRTVTVPDVGTVTWLDLVDVVAVADAVPYVIQPWMQDAMDNAAAASASAATATTKAGEAAASAASIVRGGANGVAPLDGSSRVPDVNLPTRLGVSELSTTIDATMRAHSPVSVRAYGAMGDGITLDTASINNAVQANPGRTIYFPSGTYLINAVPSGILLNQPGTKLLLDPGATIKVATNAATAYIAISATATDCAIEGGTILGDSPAHTGTTGEWGHLIQIGAGADRFRVTSTVVRQAWGDGIAISGSPSDVSIIDVIADDNRRQGLSIIGAIRPRVLGGVYKNTGLTKYTAPGAGIDIEPNPNSGFDCIDVTITGVLLTGNKGSGLTTVGATGQILTANISGCVAKGNGPGGYASGFLATGPGNTTQFTDCHSTGNTFNGFEINSTGVELTGCSSRANTFSGYSYLQPDARATACTAFGNGRSGISTTAAASALSIIGGESRGNGQTATATYINIDISGPSTRIVGHLSDAGTATNKCARGYHIRANATDVVLIGCSVRGAFTAVNYLDDTGSAFANPIPGAVKSAAIAAPTAPGAAYAQSEAAAMKTAVDAIRVALKSIGITA